MSGSLNTCLPGSPESEYKKKTPGFMRDLSKHRQGGKEWASWLRVVRPPEASRTKSSNESSQLHRWSPAEALFEALLSGHEGLGELATVTKP